MSPDESEPPLDDDLIVHLSHKFERELNLVIVTNHECTMNQIDRAEEEEEDELHTALADEEDRERLSGELSNVSYHYDQLRQAANRLALVGAVTQLEVWIDRLVKRTSTKTSKESLEMRLKRLACIIGDGPVSTQYFKELVDVRNSIVHQNALAKWEFDGRSLIIVDRYRDAYGTISFSQEDLKEAISKMVQQVSWYDEKLPK